MGLYNHVNDKHRDGAILTKRWSFINIEKGSTKMGLYRSTNEA